MTASNVKKLPTRRKAHREAGILQAASEVFAQRGFIDASISDIASRVGVAEGTLYLYFANKRELLARVIGAWYEGLVSDVGLRLPRIHGLRAQIRYLAWRHCRIYVEDTGLARLMARELRQDSSFYDTEVHALNKRYTRFILDVVTKGRASGEVITDVTPELVRDVLYGGLEHSAWKVVSGHGTIDPEQLADEYTNVVMAMLGAANTAASPRPDEIAQRLVKLEHSVELLVRAVQGEKLP